MKEEKGNVREARVRDGPSRPGHARHAVHRRTIAMTAIVSGNGEPGGED